MTSDMPLSGSILASFQKNKERKISEMLRHSFIRKFAKGLAEIAFLAAMVFILTWMFVVQCEAETDLKEPEVVSEPSTDSFDIESIDGFAITESIDKGPETVITQMPETVKIYDCPLEANLQLHIIGECEKHHIDPAVVIAQIYRESDFREWVIGDNGNSKGLMQIQERYHRDRMSKLECTNLLNPYQNVTVGIDYLAEMLERYDGNMHMALVGYNAGPDAAYQYWFSQGVYTSEYSRDIMGQAEVLKEGMIVHVLQ